jgi:hypothetical protein
MTSVATPSGSLPAQDIFVAKWSPITGSFVWAQRIGGEYYDTVAGLAVTENGIYLSGDLGSSSVTYGELNTVSTSTKNEYGFVAKLTDAGSFTWLQRVVGKMTAVAAKGNSIYVGGEYSEPSIMLGNFTLTNRSNTGAYASLYREAYITKLTDAGSSVSFIWAEPVSGTINETVKAIAVNGTNVYFTGTFESGTLAFGNVTLTSAGREDVFVAKLTDAGASSHPEWVLQAGGASPDIPNSLAVKDASVYVGGYFTGPTTTFGTSTLTNTSTVNNGTADGFLVKLTDVGTSASFIWTQQLGTTASETVEAVAVRDNTVYVAGNLNNVTGAFSLARFTDAGATSQLDWTKGATGGPAYTFGLAVNPTSVYISGWATAPVSFDGLTLPLPDKQSFGLLASLNATATPLPNRAATVLAGVSLFPNPAGAITTVHVPPVFNAAELTLTLTNALGQVISTQCLRLAAAGTTVELSTSGLAPGLYHLRLQTDKDQYSTQALEVE